MNSTLRAIVELVTGRVIWRRNRTIRALRRENEQLRKLHAELVEVINDRLIG